jgi:MinD superfamily P-loop ATPase
LKEIVVISGKGGTGKTSITASFASLAKNAILADCDVDAPDLHIIMTPKILDQRPFHGSELAIIDPDICTSCGACVEACRFEAISDDIEVDEYRCEGCGVCALVCPSNAVKFEIKRSGTVFVSDTRFGPMVHAKLDPGEEVSGKLVSEVKKEVRDLAQKKGREIILIDGPPGVGCSVIATISGADFIVVVTEPTISAIADMKRALDLADHFNIPSALCINKAGINPAKTQEIRDYCDSRGLQLLATLPYDHIITRAMLESKSVIELGESEMGSLIEDCWEKIQDRIGQ